MMMMTVIDFLNKRETVNQFIHLFVTNMIVSNIYFIKWLKRNILYFFKNALI